MFHKVLHKVYHAALDKLRQQLFARRELRSSQNFAGYGIVEANTERVKPPKIAPAFDKLRHRRYVKW